MADVVVTQALTATILVGGTMTLYIRLLKRYLRRFTLRYEKMLKYFGGELA